MKTYEAMFLFDPAQTPDFGAAEAEIRRLADRAGAKVHGITNWEERKLAYEIRHHKRGLYALTFFDAPPEKIAPMERDAQLSEKIMRMLVIRRDKMSPEAVQKALAAPPPPKSTPRGADEWSADRGGGFGDRGGRGRRDDGRGPRDREREGAVAEPAEGGGAAVAVEAPGQE